MLTRRPYRQLECVDQCKQAQVVSRCGCLHPWLSVQTEEPKQRLSSTYVQKNCMRNESSDVAWNKAVPLTERTCLEVNENQTNCLPTIHYCGKYKGFSANENDSDLYYRLQKFETQRKCSRKEYWKF